MTRTFYIYECSLCGHKECYPVAADVIFGRNGVFECEMCKGALALISTRDGTLTLHPKTGKMCIEEELRWPEDYK